MKVHIAYDDGTLIGVYRSKSAAAHQLSLHASWVGHVRFGGDIFLGGGWSKTEGGVERRVGIIGGRGWDQWINTCEVIK